MILFCLPFLLNSCLPNSISGGYRSITKKIIETRLQNYLSATNNSNIKTLKQFKNIWREGEQNEISKSECLINVYLEPFQACRPQHTTPIEQTTRHYTQKTQALIGHYNKRYQTQVGSRDRASRYIHPFIIPDSTVQTLPETSLTNYPELETGQRYWLEKKNMIFEILIMAMHATKSTPTRPRVKITVLDLKSNWIFYRVTKRLFVLENDDFEFCMLSTEMNMLIYKRKLKPHHIARKQNFQLNIDYREQTPLEVLMKSLKKDLIAICARKNLMITGNKEVLSKRILDARAAGIQDCDPKFLELMKKSKPELKNLCREEGVPFNSRNNKTDLSKKLCDHYDEVQNLEEEQTEENVDILELQDFDSDDSEDSKDSECSVTSSREEDETESQVSTD